MRGEGEGGSAVEAVPEGTGAGNWRGRFRQGNRDRSHGRGEQDAAVRTAVTDCHDRRQHRPKSPSEAGPGCANCAPGAIGCATPSGCTTTPRPAGAGTAGPGRHPPPSTWVGRAATRAGRRRNASSPRTSRSTRCAPSDRTSSTRSRRRPPGAAPASAAGPGSRGGAGAVLCHLRRRHRPGDRDAPGRGGGTAMTAESDPPL